MWRDGRFRPSPRRGWRRSSPRSQTAEDAVCVDLLTGARDALRGRKHVAQPEGWPDAFTGLVSRRDLNVIEQALLLGLDVDEPKAVAVLRRMALDPETPVRGTRPVFSRARGTARARASPADLQALVRDPSLRGLALRSLAAYDDPATPEVILRHYGGVFRGGA